MSYPLKHWNDQWKSLKSMFLCICQRKNCLHHLIRRQLNWLWYSIKEREREERERAGNRENISVSCSFFFFASSFYKMWKHFIFLICRVLGNLWEPFKNLAIQHNTTQMYSILQDRRFTSNGIQIKLFFGKNVPAL